MSKTKLIHDLTAITLAVNLDFFYKKQALRLQI